MNDIGKSTKGKKLFKGKVLSLSKGKQITKKHGGDKNAKKVEKMVIKEAKKLVRKAIQKTKGKPKHGKSQDKKQGKRK